MSNKLQFKVSAGLKNIIGRELITDDFIAIFEIVKNSFDAHSTIVIIEFENIHTMYSKIKITDNGKGMSYDDLVNKWLFVAYSAKKDGSEDFDYRNKIQSKTYYAGAKGIGRFSCDKLGSKLTLISTKDEIELETNKLLVNWDEFDQNAKEEFINVNIQHEVVNINPSPFRSGTVLEISDLRPDSTWNAEKILKLKSSLAKLINPFSNNFNRDFKIIIKAEDFIQHDKYQTEPNKIINGPIENHLLEIINEKTIKILSTISDDGKIITTELSNNGIWLYRIEEENREFNLLHNILVELYHLNRAAKNNFTRLMGIRNGEYGSIFLYKNEIRIYPYGEPGVDPLQLDLRQQKRIGDYIGNSELIGRIEISGENQEFKETTSRGDGLIQNSSYKQLNQYFIEKVVEKLESFKKNILKYGIDFDDFGNSNEDLNKIIKMVANISSNDKLLSIEYNPNLSEIITKTQEESGSAKAIIKSIEKIAVDSDDKNLLDKINKVKGTLYDAIIIADIAEEEIQIKDKELDERVKQNLFLKSIRSQEFDDLVSFMHHAGIYAQTINAYLKNISLKLNRNIEIKRDDLIDIIRNISFESNKILNITEFATKANFRLKTEDIETDLANYVSEYIKNIVPSINNKLMSISFLSEIKKEIIRKFKPIEVNIMIDNLVTNSRKALATNLFIKLGEADDKLILEFVDDGIGINLENKKNIFNFGFTTTDGSGLGLYHVKQIIEENKGSITVINNQDKGVTFKIKL